MTEWSVSRRGFVGSMTGVAATLTGVPWSELAAAGRAAAGATAMQVLTPEQARIVDAVSAQIIPTDHLPGAREAHVVQFVDRALGTFLKKSRPAFEQALANLAIASAQYAPGMTDFSQLSDDYQFDVLQLFEKTHPADFGAFRDLTVIGMIANPVYGGNFGKAGWKMLGFEDRFAWTPPFGYYDRG